MTKVLAVLSSAMGAASLSGRIAREAVKALAAREPDLDIAWRDVGSEPIPHLTADGVTAIRGEPSNGAQEATRALSDALVAELKAADVLVIAAPMYNFGMASTLKSWFDHVARAGVTFRYTEAGPEGLLAGKTAIVIETRGGVYSQGPAAAMDAQEPHIRGLLGFLGVKDVTFVRAEGLAFGPEAAEKALASAVEAARAAVEAPRKAA